MAEPTAVTRILDFWFGEAGSPESGQPRKFWFEASDEIDAAIRNQFEMDWRVATTGSWDHFAATPRGALALVILFDQFPRNMFRGTKQAFSSDRAALNIARKAVDSGLDADLSEHEKLFLYLPFEHAEDLAMQDRSVELFATLSDPQYLDYAERHRAIVARFGRFPYRNEVLGRETTAEEQAWLDDPNAETFGQKAK